jgi:hypothetical protein
MFKKLLVYIFSIISLSGLSGVVKSQDFDMNITLNTDVLPPEGKDKVKDMKLQLEDYFNKNKFYDNALFNETNKPGADLYKIKALIQITFKGTNGIDQYDAQVLIVSQRIIDKEDKKNNPRYTTLFRYIDERFKFVYNRSIQFIRNEFRFDPFISFFDYYAYLMLGMDQDSFFPKEHPMNRSIYYQKALEICNKPMVDRTGWTETGGGSKPSRLQLIQELMNPRFDDYRNGFYEYHWLGIDSLGLTRNAYAYIYNAIEKMTKVKKKEVKSYNIDYFLETKAQEIADVFLNYGDKGIYDKLIFLDPAHQRIYEDAKKRAK